MIAAAGCGSALPRHTLAWPTAGALDRLIAGSDSAEAAAALREWRDRGFPFVVRRADGPPALPAGKVAVGLPLPPSRGKRRLAMTLALREIVRHCAPLPLADIARALPPAWESALASLDRDAQALDATLRGFGSAAWQAITGLPYLHADSDVDVTFAPRSDAQLAAVLELFVRGERRAPGRIDAEIVFDGGHAVAWREWARARPADRVLAKSDGGARLVTRATLTVGRAVRARMTLACPQPCRPRRPRARAPSAAFCSRALARHATRALWDELALYPKPGLVSPNDPGAHDDMDAGTFVRSLFALRRHWAALADAGARGAPFARLRALGDAAEAGMMAVTGGINTHRGAIFVVGLLCAAAARVAAQESAPSDDALRSALRRTWGAELDAHAVAPAGRSHGAIVSARHGAGGARREGALAFPAVFEIALPALRAARAAGEPTRVARLRSLIALLANVADTNVLYRGGPAGLAFVQRRAREIARDADLVAGAVSLHGELVARRLSPGGAADLLAAALFVDALQRAEP